MTDALTQFQAGTDLNQAVRFHSREQRRALRGIPEMTRTHRFVGASMAVASIDTDAVFPERDRLVTFRTAIRITDNTGSHKGLVFEFGSALRGAALWIEDERIGFHAGAAGAVDGADAIFDNSAELPVGLELDIVAAIRPGDGRVRLWGNGREIARGVASGGDFDGDWAADEAGSFASAPATAVVTDVPAASRIAPDDGFEVIEPLSVYVGQVPRHFV